MKFLLFEGGVRQNYGMENTHPSGLPGTATRYADIPAFVTKDGSVIRELLHPEHHAICSMSFAEAIVEPGQTTQLHCHHAAEEIYHITRGGGLMRLGDQRFDVSVGDSVVIAPATPHCITATSREPLHILCACHPAYSDADTSLL
jgi:mannose-6-phosphate isomerase-like protein (cupin superfamily)